MGLFDRLWGKKSASQNEALMALLNQAQQARDQGHATRALHLYARLIEQAEREGDVAMQAAGLQQRGVTHDVGGDSEQAEADVRAAIALNETLAGDTVLSVLRQDFHALGVILMGRGDVAGAKDAFVHSAEYARRTGDIDGSDKASINVAITTEQLGHREEAIELLRHQLLGDRPRTVYATAHRGLLIDWLLADGALDEALEVSRESLVQVSYWQAKVTMGRLPRDVFDELLQHMLNGHHHVAVCFAEQGQSALAAEVMAELREWSEKLGLSELLEAIDEATAKLPRG